MSKLRILVCAFALSFLGCTTSPEQSQPPYATIGLTEISQSLPNTPIAVGFDVDDTVLFSSPAFYFVINNRAGADGLNKYGEKPFEHPQVWFDINTELDQFSLPKKIAQQLIQMHLKRGDSLFFITARDPSEDEKLTALLQRTFNIPQMHPVIFMGSMSKSTPIQQLKIQLYYGDSDADITDAQKAGIRAIRILRAENSTDPRPLHLGSYGEKILLNSAY